MKIDREAVAALCHEQWTGWMKHLFKKCGEGVGSGLLISGEFVKNLRFQMDIPYSELSAPEQDSDRKEADKFIALFAAQDIPRATRITVSPEGAERIQSLRADAAESRLTEVIASREEVRDARDRSQREALERVKIIQGLEKELVQVRGELSSCKLTSDQQTSIIGTGKAENKRQAKELQELRGDFKNEQCGVIGYQSQIDELKSELADKKAKVSAHSCFGFCGVCRENTERAEKAEAEHLECKGIIEHCRRDAANAEEAVLELRGRLAKDNTAFKDEIAVLHGCVSVVKRSHEEANLAGKNLNDQLNEQKNINEELSDSLVEDDKEREALKAELVGEKATVCGLKVDLENSKAHAACGWKESLKMGKDNIGLNHDLQVAKAHVCPVLVVPRDQSGTVRLLVAALKKVFDIAKADIISFEMLAETQDICLVALAKAQDEGEPQAVPCVPTESPELDKARAEWLGVAPFDKPVTPPVDGPEFIRGRNLGQIEVKAAVFDAIQAVPAENGSRLEQQEKRE